MGALLDSKYGKTFRAQICFTQLISIDKIQNTANMGKLKYNFIILSYFCSSAAKDVKDEAGWFNKLPNVETDFPPKKANISSAASFSESKLRK